MSFLEVRHLEKSFGLTQALRDVSFVIERCEGVVFVGPNGAGKSTLLNCLVGIHRLDSGEILCEVPKCRFGVLVQQNFLYDELTGAENLQLYAELYGVPDKEQIIKQLLERFGLSGHAEKKVKEYSQGMLKRISIARTVLHQPDILILDEPFANLDRHGREVLFRTIEDAKIRGSSVLIASHDGEVIERLADRVFFLEHGIITKELLASEQGSETLRAASQVLAAN